MASEVVSWDWKEQPDMDKIAAAVWEISGHRCSIREVNTDGDFYAILVSDQLWNREDAQAEFERVYYED